MSEEPIVEPIASPRGDFKKLGRNSQAVVGELREFLATLKGKSPKEMMGAVAESGLFQSLLVSTVVMCCLVFALSIIPYYLNQGDGQAEAVGESQVPSAGSSEVEPDSPSGESPPEPTTVPDTVQTPEQKTADLLGVGEVADPNSNPLESSGEDLLDGLDDL